MSSRAWCFTLNNYTPAEWDEARKPEQWIRYMCIGQEIAPETGTPHLQGFYYCTDKIRAARIKKKLPRAHIEMCRGTSAHNIAYCKGLTPGKTPNEVVHEVGEAPADEEQQKAAGKKAWEDALAAAKEGRWDDIDPRIYIPHVRNLEHIHKKALIIPDPLPVTSGIWVYGETGTGKSKAVFSLGQGVYRKMMNKWWDGYNGESIVVMEDVDRESAKWCGFFLKIWGDHYPFRGEIKGSSQMIRPRRFIVTSQYKIADLFPDDETRDALERRYNTLHFTHDMSDEQKQAELVDIL